MFAIQGGPLGLLSLDIREFSIGLFFILFVDESFVNLQCKSMVVLSKLGVVLRLEHGTTSLDWRMSRRAPTWKCITYWILCEDCHLTLASNRKKTTMHYLYQWLNTTKHFAIFCWTWSVISNFVQQWGAYFNKLLVMPSKVHRTPHPTPQPKHIHT